MQKDTSLKGHENVYVRVCSWLYLEIKCSILVNRAYTSKLG